MGTYYTTRYGLSKKEFIETELKYSKKYKLIDRSIRNNEVWSVVENIENGKREICLDLLRKEEGMWGYKPMCEEAHPYYYNCPLKFLKMVPCPDSENAREWRRNVIQLHNDKTNSTTQDRIAWRNSFIKKYPELSEKIGLIPTKPRIGIAGPLD